MFLHFYVFVLIFDNFSSLFFIFLCFFICIHVCSLFFIFVHFLHVSYFFTLELEPAGRGHRSQRHVAVGALMFAKTLHHHVLAEWA